MQQSNGVVGCYGARGRFGGERIVSQLFNFLEVARQHAVLHSARQNLVFALTEGIGGQACKGQNDYERAPGQPSPVTSSFFCGRGGTGFGFLHTQMTHGAADAAQDEGCEGQYDGIEHNDGGFVLIEKTIAAQYHPSQEGKTQQRTQTMEHTRQTEHAVEGPGGKR